MKSDRTFPAARRFGPAPRHAGAALLAGASLLAGALLMAPAAAATPSGEGEIVLVNGVVTGDDGLPLPDLRVVLEASRRAFSLRKLGRTLLNTSRLAATTTARGEYSISWPWNDYYNHFELVVGVPVRRTKGEVFEELERVDVSSRMLQGSPVVTALTVTDTAFVRSLREFLAGLQTDDQRQVYEQMGRPDRVQRTEYAGYAETSWWYFPSGKAYRFRDGKLLQVIPFDPVKPIR